MDRLHRFCIIVAGICLVAITLIIPWGVFTRYVLNSASSWPEPMAILLMILFSFLSAVVCYRENLHIGVNMFPRCWTARRKTAMGMLIEICMLATNLFLLWWGVKLCKATWYQAIAEFPWYRSDASYLPVPIGGAITALFVIERLWVSNLFDGPSDDAISQISTE